MARFFGDYYTDFLAVVGAVSVCYVTLKVGRGMLRVVGRAVRPLLFPVDVKQFGRWAVVTGSTDGIGKSFAFKLAEKGMDIVLISRNPEKLAAVAQEIAEKCQVSVKVITADFKEADIYHNIQQQLSGLDIGVLVNNVGMTNRRSPAYFCDAEDFEQFSRDVINVNVLSCTMMTTIVLPGMLERRKGAIVNLSSGAGSRPVPYFALYSASKAFVFFFSEALSLEYSSKGITIQVLTPNLIQSSMSKDIAQNCGIEHGLFFPTADRYVTAALNTVGQETSTSAYWPHELQQYVSNMLPKSIFRWLMLQQRNKMVDLLKTE